MTSGVKKHRFKRWWRCFGEQIKFAIKGLVLATREKHFWLGFIPTFCIFGTLLNLLSSGFAAFNLIGVAGFPGGLKIIWDAFLQTFGINRNFYDWLGIFLLALLQGLLIGLLIVVIKNTPKPGAKDAKSSSKKPANDVLARASKNATSTQALSASADASASIQNSGIVAILAVLGSGCPTCGTALLTPILTTIFGSGVALAGTVSGIITWAAILLALWTLKKLGYDAYVAIVTRDLPKTHDIIDKRSVNEKGN
ncbi:hypothetical protein IJ114_01900 [Candidatus Saccharibacteria bacterium]|nr:hypothetical protein [Candidatus Saccharibacteria bacterium]